METAQSQTGPGDGPWITIVRAACILPSAGRVLLVKNEYPDGRWAWSLPGGKADPEQPYFHFRDEIGQLPGDVVEG